MDDVENLPINAWRLDDGDPALAQVGNAFIAQAARLGVPTITAHKGLVNTLGYGSEPPFEVREYVTSV